MRCSRGARMAGLTGLAGLVLAVSGCSGADPEPDPQADPSWPDGGDSLEVNGVVRERDGVVHLADGSTLDLGRPVSEYVVAQGAVYFTSPADSGGPQAESSPLWWATADGTVEQTEAAAAPGMLRVSPDGRYLAYLDDVTGPTDADDHPIVTLVVVDTETGTETVRTTDGMGEPSDDSYAEGAPSLVAVTGEAAYVSAHGRTNAFDLASGEAETDVDVEIEDGIWAAQADRWNPSRTWSIRSADAQQNVAGGELFLGTDGDRVTPRTGSDRWVLERWLTDDTVLGRVVLGPGADLTRFHPGDHEVSITCRVPSGECTRVPHSRRAAGEPAPIGFPASPRIAATSG